MAVIGRVSLLQGRVVAEDAAGNQRVLAIGDNILDTDKIITSPGATIEISMLTGDEIVIADGQSWSPTTETFTRAQDFPSSDATLSPEDLALQEALLAGADPTQVGEATAAGAPGAGTFGAADGGGSSFVRTSRTAGEVDPSAGYDTIGTEVNLVPPIIDPQTFSVAETPFILTLQIVATDIDGVRLTVSEVEEGAAVYYKVILVDDTGTEVVLPAGGFVDITFTDITATGQVDYVSTSLNVAIGEVFQTEALDDLFSDSGEKFSVNLVPGSTTGLILASVDGLLSDAEGVTTTINDETDPGSEDTVFVQISVDKQLVEEGETLIFTLSLVDENANPVIVPAGSAITIDLAWSGDASNISDASPLPGSVTFSGSSETSFVVNAVDDAFNEGPEDLVATITQVTDVNGAFEVLAIGGANQASTIIIDEPEDPDSVFAQISADKASVEEGGQLTYTVNLIDINGDPVLVPVGDSVTVVLDWTGAAANPSDAAVLPLSVTITGGSQTTFVVDAIDDVYKEDPEALVATITSVDDVDDTFEKLEVGTQNQANATITDEATPNEDVVRAQISVDKASVEEGGQLTYTVNLIDINGDPVLVPVGDSVTVVLDWTGPAANPGDAAVLPLSVTITGGSSITFVVDAIDDVYKEDPEALVATITSVDDVDDTFEKLEIGAQNQANATITDEATPNEDVVRAQISVDKASVEEGGQLTYTVNLIDINGDPVLVPVGDSVTVVLDWTGPAANPGDAAVLPASVTITGGSSTTFVVDAIDDVYKEDPEALVATITSVDDVDDTFEKLEIGSQNQANASITDEATPNEDVVRAQISVDKASVEEGDQLTYTVNLIDINGDPVLVPVGDSVTVLLDWTGAAANPGDAAVLPLSVTITGGSSTTFVVDAIDDVYKEDPEALVATITAVDDVDDTFEKLEVGTQNQANATITDEATPNEDVVRAQISVDKASVEEGGQLTYTVNLIDINGDPVLVPVGDSVTVVLDWTGPAANPGDAAVLPLSVTITGGSSITFVVDAIDDVYKEDPEALVATITSVDDVDDTFEKLEIGAQNQANATITDEATPNEDVVRAQISVDKASVEEGGQLTYTVNLIDINGDPVLVPVGDSITVVLDWTGPAANPGDAAVLPLSVTITGGSSTTFVVDAIDDVYKEDPEALVATITSVDDVDDTFEKLEIGSQNQANATMTDEATPNEDVVRAQISVDKATVEEGGQLTYTVNLIDINGDPVLVPVGDSVTVVLDWTGPAANPGDAAVLPASVTITGGSQTTFVVDAIDDVYKEDPEALVATITSVDDVDDTFEKLEIGTQNQANATITDESTPNEDVVRAQISVDKASVEEGGQLTYTVNLIDINGDPVLVPVGDSVTVVLDWTGPAANPGDAAVLPLSVTITGGSQTTFVVDAIDDVYKEDPEALVATITSVDDVDDTFEKLEIGAQNQANATITDEATPNEDVVRAQISVDKASVEEGGQLTYTVNLIDINGDPVLVPVGDSVTVVLDWTGPAANPGDAAVLPASVTITGGSYTTFVVDAIDDVYKEDPEALVATITSVDDVDDTFEKLEIGAQNQANATITDEATPNEDVVRAQISVDKASVEEGGQLTYTVNLIDINGDPVLVPVGDSVTVVLDWTGPAANPSDAAVLPASVTITGGSSTTFVVDAIDDVYKEDPEALVATITSVDDVADTFEKLEIGTQNKANATITDEATPNEDVVRAQISVDKASVEEGGQLTYTVNLIDINGDPVLVPVGDSVTVVLDWTGAAANPGDAAVLPLSVTITGGSQTTFVVDAIDDVYKEDPEALVATITSVDDVDDTFEKLEIGAQNQANATITDEATPNEDVVRAQISVDKASVEEGGQLTYTVNLIDINGDPVLVPVGDSVTVVLDWTGAAANPGDAAVLPANVTITGGSSTTFVVDAIDDVYKEDPEALVATITSVDDVDDTFEKLEIGTQNQANATITDEATPNEDVVRAQISVDKASVEEGGQLTYTVNLIDINGDPVLVPVGDSVTVVLDWTGAAANPSDAAVLPLSVTITGGSQTTFVVDAIDDVYKEDPEALVATITSVDDVDDTFEKLEIGAQNQANATITDEAPPNEDVVRAQISVDKASVEEGGQLTYTVNLIDINGDPVLVPVGDSVTVVLDWTGPAANPGDAAVLPGSVTITGGSATTFVVDAIDDVYKEDPEALVATITSVDDVDDTFEKLEIGSQNQANATITDEATPNEDVVRAQISVDKASVEEGGQLTYTVNLIDINGDPVLVPVGDSVTVVLDWTGAAANPGDAAVLPLSVTITGGSQTTFVVDAIDDVYKEDPEALVATITSVDDVDDTFEKLEIGAQNQANATITDEATPNEDVVRAQISVDKASVEEGGQLTYTVNLIDINGDPVLVPVGDSVTVVLDWTGPAANPSDAAVLPASVTITGGSSTTFVVDAIDDVYKEDPEALVATITSVDDVDDTFEKLEVGAQNQANATITDEATPNEDVVRAQISVDKASVEEGGQLTYTVNLIDINGDPVLVPVGDSVTVVLDWTGPAANSSDAAVLPLSVTITGGSQTTFVVDAIDDVYKEDPEALVATITSVDNVDDTFEKLEIGAQNQANSTITDEATPNEDVVRAKISVDKASVEEGGQLTYTVNLIDINGDPVLVPVGDSVTVVLDWTGPAANPGDAAVLPASVTITGGSQTTFVVDAIDDVYKEDPEALVATITSVDDVDDTFEKLEIGSQNQANATITDEATPNEDVVRAQISVDKASVEEGGQLTYTVNLIDINGDPVLVPVGDSVTVVLDWTGPAANPGDAAVLPLSVTITAGSQTTFVVDAIDDVYKEDPEALVATISSVDDVDDTFEKLEIGTQNQANATITDEATPNEDVVRAQISVDKASVEEGGQLTYTVNLIDINGDPVLVPVGDSVTVVLDWTGAAANPGDAAVLPGSVTITGGSQTTFVVDAIDDVYKEDPEALIATITSVDDVDGTFEKLEIGAQNQANATITDEATPNEDVVRAQISVDKASVEEGGQLTYTVNLIDINGDPVLVLVGDSVTVVLDWTGPAANPGDATVLPASVTITGGSQTTFVVDAIDDVYKEDPEALVATITSVDDVDDTFEKLEIGAQNQANATITDESTPNEDVVRAQISVDKASVEEGGLLTYTVNLIDINGDPVVVPAGDSVTVVLDWTGPAANPGDATVLPASVTITGGSQTTFVVDAIDDVYKEDPEALVATITSVDDVDDTFEKLEIGAQNQANATITDEAPPNEDVVFAVIESTGAVNEGGLSEFVISLVDKDGNPVTVIQSVAVDVSFSHLTSEPGDFNANPVTVTINAGSSENFFIQTISDLDVDDETFKASITSVDDGGQFEKVDWMTGVLVGTANERSPSAVAIIIDVNQPVQLNNITLNVSEEGLIDGLVDTTGISNNADGTVDPTDTTNSASDAVSMNFNDPEGAVLTATLQAPTPVLSSGGTAIVWSGVGTDTLMGTAGGSDVISIHVDSSGLVSVELLAPVDHPINSVEDVLSLDLNVNVSDGVNNTLGTVTVNIEDDRPVSGDIVEGIEIGLQKTNLMFIIDTSGSMRRDAETGSDTITTIERMELLLNSITQVINGYDDLGNVRVQLVTFAGSEAAATHQAVWMSAQQALDFIGDGTNGSRDPSLTPDGGTNYDAALNEAQQGFESIGKLTDALNVSYFLSDGQPTTAGGTENSDGITGAEIGQWTDYLELHDINSFAIGFGSGLDVSDQGELDPIAYDGINEVNTDGVIVVNSSQLAAQLLNTIDSTLAGNILGGTENDFGADGGRLLSVTVDGVIYTLDPTANGGAGEITTNTSLTIAGTTFDITTALNGHLILNLGTGEYSYIVDDNLAEGQAIQEVFDYSLIDNDGDNTSGTITFNINRAQAPDLGLVNNLAQVDEEAMPDGTNSASNAEIVSGNLVTDDANVLTSQLLNVTIAGGTTDISVAGQITVTTAQGNSLVVNSDTNSANYGDYTYSLINAVNHHHVAQPGTAINILETYDSAAQVATWGSDPSINSNRMRIEQQESATKLFDFGVGHANQLVTIEFDLDVNNSVWESNQDSVKVSVNGVQQMSVSLDGTHSFSVYLDGNGRADIIIYDDASANDEYVYIDNFTITGPNAQVFDPNNNDPFIDQFTYTVLDDSGFTGDATLAVTIINDLPVSFTPESAVVLNQATQSAAFDIEFAESAGADGVGNVVFTSSAATPLMDGNGNAITYSGDNIYLYVISDNVLEGRTSNAGPNQGSLAFTATLDPNADTYSIDLEGLLVNSAASNGINPVQFSLAVQGIDNDGDSIDSDIDVSLSQLGIAGANIDVDTYVYNNGSVSSNKHVHAYDLKSGYNDVIDAFDYVVNDHAEIDDTVNNDYFMLVVLNGHRNAGTNIVINGDSTDAYLYGSDGLGGAKGFDNQVYTLVAGNVTGAVKLLTGLQISFDENAILLPDVNGNFPTPDGNGDYADSELSYGIRMTETKYVKKDEHGTWSVADEHRDGALSVMAVKVVKDNNGQFIDPTITYGGEPSDYSPNANPYIVGLDANQLLWETSVFAHTSGDDPRTDAEYIANAALVDVINSGIFVDGIVEGLAYITTSGLSGITDASGGFKYLSGDMISFSIGSVLIGTVTSAALADGTLFLQEIAGVGLEDMNNDYVEKMAVLLQSLDNDGDAYNGIVIEQSVHDILSNANFDMAMITKTDLQSLLNDHGFEAIDEDSAMQHVRDMIELETGQTQFDQRSSLTNLMGTDEDDIFSISVDENSAGGDEIIITNFAQVGNDVLDLSDIFSMQEIDNDLSAYFNVSFDGEDTIIEVSASGAFTGEATDVSHIDKVISLQGVNLVGGIDNIDTIIQDMLDSGLLIIDE